MTALIFEGRAASSCEQELDHIRLRPKGCRNMERRLLVPVLGARRKAVIEKQLGTRQASAYHCSV